MASSCTAAAEDISAWEYDDPNKNSMFVPEDRFVFRDLIASHQVQLALKQRVYLKIRRAFEIAAAACGLAVLVIPFAVIAIISKLTSPKEPVLFLQDRVGRGGKIFRMIKFRSMSTSAPHDIPTSELENAESYITPLGKFLRRTSIDELPQIINVLKGDMSIIGPRPLVPHEEPAQFLREYYGVYAVRPGITGLAQVNGRDTLNDVDKVRFDRAYVRNICPRLDLLVLLKSVGYVVKEEGIVEGKQPIPRFAEYVYGKVEADYREGLEV